MYPVSEHTVQAAQLTPSPQYSPTHSHERSLAAVAVVDTFKFASHTVIAARPTTRSTARIRTGLRQAQRSRKPSAHCTSVSRPVWAWDSYCVAG